MTIKNKSVWESEEVATFFLEGERGAIPGTKIQLNIILKIIREWFDRPSNILDLGCGDGILGRYLLNSYPEADSIFLDVSDTMLEAAKKNLSGFPRAKIIKSDFSNPGWLEAIRKKEPIDVVVSGFSIHHMTDSRKKELYNEIYEILTPGGIFLNLEHVQSATENVESLFEQYYVDHLHDFQLKNNPGIKREEVEEYFINRPDKDEDKPALVDLQCLWLKEIGFKDVDCFFKLFEISLFGGRK